MKTATSPFDTQCESLCKSAALSPLDVRYEYPLRWGQILHILFKFTFFAVQKKKTEF